MLLRYQRAILIGFTLLIYSLQGYTNVLAVDQIISEQEGKTVIVPCPVNKDKCGELHSLNWFKGDNRIAAMLLDDSNVTSVAEEFEDRVSVEQNPFRLIIRNLQISDEDIYLCDTTYFIPIETCDNFNGHRVELNVLVPPSEVVILDEKGDRIANGSIVGPMQERQTIKATCIVKNTRPQPQVGWWRGNKRLTTHSPSYDEKDGLFTATLELSLQLSRDDLGHSIECRAESAAIENTITNQFSVDLQVRPTTVTINGVEHHTVQGSKVVLTCDVHGARPPVNLTWFNASQPMDPQENDLMEIRTRAFEKEDGTYHTQSDLIFNASRFENDVKFVCQAENIVLQINREAPMQSLLTLEVLYPPVVKVSPLEITVNTSDTVLLNCEYVANPASLDHVVWYRNGEVVNVNDTQRYEGGKSENVALVIRSTDKHDIGNYTCQLSNSIGKGVSEQQIDLDVQFVPIVEVLMIPEGPVKESDESNVTLFCNILDANPAVLTKVRWYANATLLKELPDCEETREDLCHIDPSKLLLESIGRGFFYNYSCEGYNAAGWGPRSEDKELLVHYEPGPATLTHFPLTAVKKKSVTFSCAVDDPGYPESNRYRWLRGGRGPLQDIVTKDWTVEPVGLDSRTNYSCYAFNEGGKGVMATVNLEVHAPPFFIKNLSPYTGVLHTSRNANLTCRIECVPRCEISWLKDGVAIEKNDTRYFVKDKYMDASPATGDFESMLSVLHFNMSNWPNNKFDIEGDNANYTCVSTGNTVGPGIKSATYFSIEYAPDNTTVSEEVVYVQEETIPGRVICKSRANPEPTYEWRFNNKTVIRGNALIINTAMMRNDTGRYTCVAFNKHGSSTAETFIDVQFKPRCEIERQEIEDKDTLICAAFGNPEEADFSWSIKAENETVEWLGNGDHKTFKDKSYYELKEDYAIARTYRCVANNTAGIGTFCEIEVAEQLGWWQRWDKTTLIILVASILLLLLAVIIICCIIICICRRRRRQDKYRTDVSMSATHSVLSYQPHMPQVLSANTVLPDTLKVPIISNMLLPAMAEQGKDTANIKTTPNVMQTTTPKQTPILTKHINVTETKVQCSDSSGSSTNKNNNANDTEIHNIINSTTITTTTTPPATSTDTIHTVVTIASPTAPTTTTVTTHIVNTPPLSVRCTQVPKSPPRWPLRPGVMVHVSSDTKENLAVNRMTLKPTAILPANLTASTLNDSSLSSSTLNNSAANTTQTTLLNVTRQSSTLGRIGRQGRVQQSDQQDFAFKVEGNEHHNQQQHLSLCQTLPLRGKQATNLTLTPKTHAINLQPSTDVPAEVVNNIELAATNNNELDSIFSSREAEIVQIPETRADPEQTSVTPLNKKLSNFKKVELFFTNIFFKRSAKSDGCRDSQRSHVGLLGGKFWKRSEAAATQSCKSPFSTEHRLKGIRSSGSVTYKKCAKTTATKSDSSASSTNTITNNSTTATIINSNTLNNNNNNNNDLQISNNTGLTTTTAQAQQQTPLQRTTPTSQQKQQQHPLPVLVTSMSHFSNINHPPQIEQNEQGPASVTTHGDTSITTVIQSIPSTIVSSRELGRNPSLGSQRKGILKAPTPPPRPPPITRAVVTTLKRSAGQVNSQKIERIQTVQEKSSSMADPLTEPGEYENLPFHGLQTAPNKFTTPTTPTNFNNNTNVVRSVPRPKRLNGNISQNTTATTTQPTYYDEHETETQQQQQQQQQYYHQQQQYSTMPYNRHNQHPANTTASATLSGMQTLIPNSSAPAPITARNEGGITVHNSNNSGVLQQQQQQPNGLSVAPIATNSTSHHMTYNLNNCFPKSYTEYYQQQQQQQQNPQSQNFAQKFNSSAAPHMLNAIEHDFDTYAVVERQQVRPNINATLKAAATAGAATTNPFLAVSNFKKFDKSGDEDVQSGNYQSTSMKRQGKRKTFADKLEDKRFYSLKFSSNNSKQKGGNKSSTAAAALNLNHSFNCSPGEGGGGALGSLLSANKCKRHHSFAGGSLGDIDPKCPARNPHMNFYDPPAYENLNDAVQVHSAAIGDMELPDGLTSSAQTATVLLHPLPYGIAGGSQGPKKKHHQRQHQPKEDLNLIEPERLSIYRSDSGISNSSYECVTPLPSTQIQTPGSTPPPGKMPRTPKTPKTPKALKTQTLAHTVVTAHFNTSHKKQAPRVPPTPLYMNVNDQQHASSNISNLERPTSPTSTVATSAYESTSSSQNDNTCNDPTSLSSTTSLYSGGGGNKTSLTAINQRCSRHQQPPEITTPEEFEQYQLGHHAHAHSSSSLSVASSVSASGSNAGAGARVKCKKQQQQRLNGQGYIMNHMELNKRKPLAHNPFLAANPAAASATTCHKKLHRRQTISDPYAHIKHINECRRQSNNTNIDNSNGNNHKAHNYCTKSTNTLKTTTADDTQSSAATCSPYKRQQQQVDLQQYNKSKQPSSSSLPYSTATTSYPQYAAHHQQMLMHKNVVNNSKITIDDNGRPYNEVVIHVVDNENNVATADHDYQDKGDQSFDMPHRTLYYDVANNETKQERHANQVVRRGHNRSLSNTNNLVYPTLEDATNTTLTTTAALGYMERPVKLPLRKYHSFHFQPTQTVAGQQTCQLQQLQQNYLQTNFEMQLSHADSSTLSQPYAKQGPLVFRPYEIDENVTFKPIQPSEESEDSLDYVREYVGTVEKFLKDEEKYMDSGDFTNLTQRLKQQQQFLNTNNSPNANDRAEDRSLFQKDLNESCKHAAQTDSEPNSLYEDLMFQSKKDIIHSPDYKSPSAVAEANAKSQFTHSTRALHLLKTVIENDSFQSEEELDLRPQYSITQRDCVKSGLAHEANSPKSFALKRKIKDLENKNAILEFSGSALSQDLGSSKEITKSPKQSTFSCAKQESINAAGAVRRNESFGATSSTCLTSSMQITLSNDHSSNIIKTPAKKQDLVKYPNSPKNSFPYQCPMDLENNAVVSKQSELADFVNSPKSCDKHNNNINDECLNFQNMQNKAEEICKTAKAYAQPVAIKNGNTLLNNNPPQQFFDKEQTLKSTYTEQSNSLQQPATFLSRKCLTFSLDNSKSKENIKNNENVKENKEVDSILSAEDLEKLFKPHELHRDLHELAAPRIVSTALNPAASLEALEMLTKSNPELWTSNQAGSRHNLHQLELFHTLQQQNKTEQAKTSQQEDEEEDLGYSFCEDDNDEEEEEDGIANKQKPTTSPNVTLLMAPKSQLAGQVKYILTQNHGEVHI